MHLFICIHKSLSHIVTVHRKCLVSRDDTRQFDLCWAAFAILAMFFFVHLTLEYDYMCSETDFTQESKRIGLGGKVGLSKCSSLLAAAGSQNGQIAV